MADLLSILFLVVTCIAFYYTGKYPNEVERATLYKDLYKNSERYGDDLMKTCIKTNEKMLKLAARYNDLVSVYNKTAYAQQVESSATRKIIDIINRESIDYAKIDICIRRIREAKMRQSKLVSEFKFNNRDNIK